MRLRLIIIAILCLLVTWQHRSIAADDSTWTITIGDPVPAVFSGRIIADIAESAVLLEERNGKQHQVSARQIESRTDTGQRFVPFNSEELAADLLQQVPSGFESFETEHYIICSNSASEYIEFCGRLLEAVFDQYFRFMAEQGIVVRQPERRLPVIVFTSAAEFQTYASKQHPEISFADTPGYFSVRDNQTLLLDLTGDRSIRSMASIRKRLAENPLQLATVVHEAVHQLAFNSGLQVRMADNPLWLSEGLAMYFETTSLRSSLLWSRPGLVNPRHQPAFIRLLKGQEIPGGMNSLIQSDSAFLNPVELPAAYAKAWALTYYLLRKEKTGMQKYFRKLSQRKPMAGMTAEERILEFREVFGKTPDEMEQDLVSFVRRQRVLK